MFTKIKFKVIMFLVLALFSYEKLHLHRADDEAKVWSDYFSSSFRPTSPGKIGDKTSEYSSNDKYQYYIKLARFHDFKGPAISAVDIYGITFVFISECSFTKVNPNNNDKKPAVINFCTKSRVLLYRCCARECVKEGDQNGIFIHTTTDCQDLHLYYCTIYRCNGNSANSNVYYQKEIDADSPRFSLKNANFSQNSASDSPGFKIVNSGADINYCTFESNTATLKSIISQITSPVSYSHVAFIGNKAMMSGLMIESKYDTFKKSTLNEVYFKDNFQDEIYGNFAQNNVKKNAEYYPEVLNTFGCENRYYTVSYPLQTPIRSPMETPPSTPSSTPERSPSRSPTASQPTTQQLNVYYMHRKEYLIGE